jgi:hypothetical protein
MFALPLLIQAQVLNAQLSPADFAGNLPIFIIDTHNQTIQDANRIVADFKIIDNGQGLLNHYFDPEVFSSQISIEIRGNSSQMFPKKSYSFETQKPDSTNLNVSLLGLPEENDWILYGPYSDKTLIRNILTYQLSNEMGNYASRTALCEVFINQDYKGIYILGEKIKRDKNRVDIDELDETCISGDSLSGGYIIAVNWRGGSDYDWISPVHNYNGNYLDLRYQFEYPDKDAITAEQSYYIKYFMTQFEQKMISSEYNSQSTGYNRVIDAASFIDFFLIQEITNNVDGYRLSTYLFKVRDSKGGKLYAGPVWDFNLGYGNADYGGGWTTYNWALENPNVISAIPFYFKKLREDSNYENLLRCRWDELREQVLDTSKLMNQIDSLVLTLGDAIARNNMRWNVIGNYVWPNYFVGASYQEEIDYLKNWLKLRLTWIDDNLPGVSGNCESNLTDKLILTEICYQSGTFSDAGDWFEVKNVSNSVIDLSWYNIKDNNTLNSFRIPAGTILGPGEYLVFASDLTKFSGVYPDVVNVVGSFGWSLSTTDAVRMFDSNNWPVFGVWYGNGAGWPDLSGTIASLELIDETLDPSDPYSWMQGCPLGSPGTEYIYPCPQIGIDDQLTETAFEFNMLGNGDLEINNRSGKNAEYTFNTMDGKSLFSGSLGNGSNRIDLSAYSSGVYFIRIGHVHGVVSWKVVKL